MNGIEKTINILGVVLNDTTQKLYTEKITELFKEPRKPCKCILKSQENNDKLFVKILYLGWQDKSGDVWIDLATTLLHEGIVKVADGKFSEKEEYLQNENEARNKGIGIWAKKK